MELPKDARPMTARFTSPREVFLVAPDGSRCQRFQAGETLPVHRDLFATAIDKGLVPEESLEYKEPEKPVNKTRETSVKEGLLEACKTLIIRANPADFTTTGKPRAASIKKLVDFDFTAKDANTAFALAIHEVEQYGDDSKEHSESSGSAS